MTLMLMKPPMSSFFARNCDIVIKTARNQIGLHVEDAVETLSMLQEMKSFEVAGRNLISMIIGDVAAVETRYPFRVKRVKSCNT